MREKNPLHQPTNSSRNPNLRDSPFPPPIFACVPVLLICTGKGGSLTHLSAVVIALSIRLSCQRSHKGEKHSCAFCWLLRNPTHLSRTMRVALINAPPQFPYWMVSFIFLRRYRHVETWFTSRRINVLQWMMQLILKFVIRQSACSLLATSVSPVFGADAFISEYLYGFIAFSSRNLTVQISKLNECCMWIIFCWTNNRWEKKSICSHTP